MKAVIDTPRFSKDYKCNKIFYVLCPLNLNDIPDIEVRTRRGKAGNANTSALVLVLVLLSEESLSGWTALTVCCDCAGAGQGLLISPTLLSVPTPGDF